MKKKIFSLLLLVVLLLGITACGKKVSLDEIVNKFNNCETVKTYKSYGFDMSASATKDTLTITSAMGEEKTTIEFKLDGNILSNESIANDDLLYGLLVIDSVGQVFGYKDGELAQNMNAFPDEIQKYTLDKEGFEIKLGEENSSIKLNLSKKIPLISMDKFYITTDELDIVAELVADKNNGNQSGKSGNIAYDVFVGDSESTITVGQDGKLADSAYKSILSALEVMYGKDVADHFKEIYPKFVSEKTTVEAFTIETGYKMEDQDESVFKDTEVVLVTIDNKNVK